MVNSTLLSLLEMMILIEVIMAEILCHWLFSILMIDYLEDDEWILKNHTK